MAPEILIGSDISRAGATVEDLLRVDTWAYAMLLFNLLNPCRHHPFQEVLKQEENDDTKEKIIRIHRNGEGFKETQKYAERCQVEWHNVWKVYEACTVGQPFGRPDARNAQYHTWIPFTLTKLCFTNVIGSSFRMINTVASPRSPSLGTRETSQ